MKPRIFGAMTAICLCCTAFGYFAGMSRGGHDQTAALDRERSERTAERERFKESTETLIEQIRRVQEAYDNGDPQIGVPISAMSSYARRVSHLPEELAKK